MNRETKISVRRVDRTIRADQIGVIRAPVLTPDVLDRLAYATSAELGKVVKDLVAEPYVREALYLASPSLYGRLVVWENERSEFNNLTATIARYLLRMAYRATPFGTFSYVSSVRCDDEHFRLSFPSRSELVRAVEIDSLVLSKLTHKVRADSETRQCFTYRPNDTLTLHRDEVSYIAYKYGATGKRTFRRVRVEEDSYLRTALELFKDGAIVSSAIDRMFEILSGDASREDIEHFVWGLVEEQILCCDELMDITCDDQLASLISKLGASTALSRPICQLKAARDALRGNEAVDVPSSYDEMRGIVGDSIASVGPGNIAKVDLYDKSSDRYSIDRSTLKLVEQALESVLISTQGANRLSKFSGMFVERFGDSEVPLLQVADELEALGYIDRTSLPPLAKVVGGGVNKSVSSRVQPHSIPIVDLVLAQALQSSSQQYINIEPFYDKSRQTREPRESSALTTTAWLSFWKSSGQDRVIELRSVGSGEPGRLMGRFAGGLPEVADYLRSSAESDNQIVCEIVHQPNDSLGNICSRPTLSQYELRIRAGAPSGAQSILLNDLMLSVHNGNVRLRSISMNRFVLLRMSNAHAFDKQEYLPIYRFLNHIADQREVVSLPSIRSRLSTSGFAPGLKFGKVILSRPTWKIGEQEIERLRRANGDARRNEIALIRQNLGLPTWIALAQGDNVIPFNLDSDWMVDDLVRNILRGKEAVVTDVYPEGMTPYSTDLSQRFHEIQIAFRRQGASRLSGRNTASKYSDAISPIWGHWCYFNVYSSTTSQNEILKRLRPELEKVVTEGSADKYFFVRYRDSIGPHLRLRLRGGSQNTLGAVLSQLNLTFSELQDSRLVQSITVQPYVREVSRYGGPDLTSACEDVFCEDSCIALDFISEFNTDSVSAWRSAAAAIDSMIVALGIESIDDRFAFATRSARDFSIEQNFGSHQRKKIGEIYRQTERLFVCDRVDDAVAGAKLFFERDKILKLVVTECGLMGALRTMEVDEAYELRWSLLHMRLNRLFTSEARLQEAIVWELLKRSYAGVLQRDGRR